MLNRHNINVRRGAKVCAYHSRGGTISGTIAGVLTLRGYGKCVVFNHGSSVALDDVFEEIAPPLTQAELFKAVRALGLEISRTERGEYHLAYQDAEVDFTYDSADRHEVLSAARVMHQGKERRTSPPSV